MTLLDVKHVQKIYKTRFQGNQVEALKDIHFTVANFGIGVIIYIILASILPTKEEIEAEMYGTGPRKRKEAEAIDDNDGWFW